MAYEIQSDVIKNNLIRKFGPEVIAELAKASLTEMGVKSADPDIFAWLVLTREDDLNKALSARTTAATDLGLTKIEDAATAYDKVRKGEATREDLMKWVVEFFGNDVHAFERDYPQGCWYEYARNGQLIFEDLFAYNRAPEYAELVQSFNRLMLPNRGTPQLAIRVPDGRVVTGRELAEQIKLHPLELLEANLATAKANRVSADDYRRQHPELEDRRPSALLHKRFVDGWSQFLKSDLGQKYANIAQIKPEAFAQRVGEYMQKHELNTDPASFGTAAKAVCEQISVNLDNMEIHKSSGSVVTVRDSGGHGIFSANDGVGRMGSGQLSPQQTENSEKVYTKAEMLRLERSTSASEWQTLINSSPAFRKQYDDLMG